MATFCRLYGDVPVEMNGKIKNIESIYIFMTPAQTFAVSFLSTFVLIVLALTVRIETKTYAAKVRAEQVAHVASDAAVSAANNGIIGEWDYAAGGYAFTVDQTMTLSGANFGNLPITTLTPGLYQVTMGGKVTTISLRGDTLVFANKQFVREKVVPKPGTDATN